MEGFLALGAGPRALPGFGKRSGSKKKQQPRRSSIDPMTGLPWKQSMAAPRAYPWQSSQGQGQDYGVMTRLQGMNAYPWMKEYSSARSQPMPGQASMPSWMPQPYRAQERQQDPFSRWFSARRKEIMDNDLQARLWDILTNSNAMPGIRQQVFY